MRKNHAMAFESAKAHARIQQIQDLLSVAPMRASDLAAKLGLSIEATYLYLRHLRGQVHATGIDTSRGCPAKLFAWGQSDEPEQPALKAPQPTRARNRPREISHSISPERLAHLRGCNYFKPQPARRDPTVAMFFGPAGAVP